MKALESTTGQHYKKLVRHALYMGFKVGVDLDCDGISCSKIADLMLN